MSLVDTSTASPYHDNNAIGAAQLWYNHMNGVPIPVGTPFIRIPYIRVARQFSAARVALNLVNGLNISLGQSVLLIGSGFGWTHEALQKLLPTSKIVSLDTGGWIKLVKDTDEADEINAALDAAISTTTREPVTLTPEERQVWLDRLLSGPRDTVGVLDEGLVSGRSRSRVKSQLGISGSRKADWAISEQVLPWLDDAECLDLSKNAHTMANNVAHLLRPALPKFLSETEPNPWNWKWLDSTAPTTDLLAAQPWYTTTSWKALLPNDLIMGDSEKYRVV